MPGDVLLNHVMVLLTVNDFFFFMLEVVSAKDDKLPVLSPSGVGAKGLILSVLSTFT